MKKYLMMLILISLLPGALCIAATYTDEDPANHYWRNSNNWDSPPGPDQDAEMTLYRTICEVLLDDDLECRGVYVGCYGAKNEMYMYGGELACRWFNVGRGGDPNSDGYFEMTDGVINTEESLTIPEQFDSAGNYMTKGEAKMTGGTINISAANFAIGDRINGQYGGGYGTLEMYPGAKIYINAPRTVDPEDPSGPGIPSLTEEAIIEDLLDGYITADTNTVYSGPPVVYPSAMIIVDANEAGIILRAEDTLYQQAYDPIPGSWFTDLYTISSQTTNLNWTSAPSKYKEYLYFSDDESLVTSKSSSVKTDVSSASRPYSVGSLEIGKTYYWQIETQIVFTKYDGQIWRLRVPNSVQVDDFDFNGYTGIWTDSGSVSSKEDNAGLKYSPDGKNLKIIVGASQSGEVSSVPAGSDWTVKNVGGLYVDVYGNEANDAGVTLTLTLKRIFLMVLLTNGSGICWTVFYQQITYSMLLTLKVLSVM